MIVFREGKVSYEAVYCNRYELRGMQCHVNLIPLNSVPERGLTGVTEREVDAFKHTLEQKGISVTRRREMGDDIEGACGQLRRRYIQDNNLNTEN